MPQSEGHRVIEFGRFTADLRSGELKEGTKRVAIQGKVLELLSALLEHPGELVAREKLYARLWPGMAGDHQRGLDTAVKKLRKMLGDPADRPLYVETLPRRGYRLLMPVFGVEPPEKADPAAGKTAVPWVAGPKQTDSEAGRLYLQGYHCWNKRTPASQNQALAYFLRALALDPTNSDYNAAIAVTHLMRAWHGVERPIDCIAEAKSAALTALMHNYAQVLAHMVLATARGAFDYDLKGAVVDLRAAIEAAPVHPWGYLQLGMFLIAVAAYEPADEALRKAHEIDPVSPTLFAVRGYALYLSGRLEEAEKAGRQAVDRDPEFGLAHFYYGMALMALLRLDEAIQHLRRADQLMAEAMEVRALLGVAFALGGNRARAAQIDEELDEAARTRYVDAYNHALLKDALGMRDTAVALLEQACDDHSHWFYLAAVAPRLAALRSDHRVQILMRRLRK